MRRVATRGDAGRTLAFVLATAAQVASAQTTGAGPLRAESEGAPPAEADTRDADADDTPRRWQRTPRTPPRNVVSLPLFSLLHRGVALRYERALPMRTSVAGSVGFGRPAAGDFSSRRRSVSLSARYFVVPRGPFTRFTGEAPVGLFLEARLGIARTALYDASGDFLGAHRRVAFGTSLGYRFSIRGVVELTPTVGSSFYAELDRYLPTMIRPTASFGLDVGGMFRGRAEETAVERRAGIRRVDRQAARDARRAAEAAADD